MTSRRLIRIKVLQLLYAYTKKEGATLSEVEKDLFKSITKSTDLYYHIFLLLTEIQHKAFMKVDAARNRLLVSERDLNPNTRFVDNPVIAQIAQNRQFKNYVRGNLVSLTDIPEIINLLFNRLTESEFYQQYMDKPEVTYNDHKSLVLSLISELIAPDEDFYQAMEEKNIFWNDDFELVLSIAYKTIKNLREDTSEEEAIFIPIYIEDEDNSYAKELFRHTALGMQENTILIDKFTLNWDIERISDMEKLIMNVAITELKHFPSIPVKVTFDEYIEIAKSYCSGKSSSFINGILDNILAQLKEKGEIQKTGRGLMEGIGESL